MMIWIKELIGNCSLIGYIPPSGRRMSSSRLHTISWTWRRWSSSIETVRTSLLTRLSSCLRSIFTMSPVETHSLAMIVMTALEPPRSPGWRVLKIYPGSPWNYPVTPSRPTFNLANCPQGQRNISACVNNLSPSPPRPPTASKVQI